MRTLTLSSFSCALAILLIAAAPKKHGEAATARLQVTALKDSQLIRLHVESPRRIGDITIEVRDETGRTWYKEEGKAGGQELVRYLDKRVLPIGRHTVWVMSRDLRASESIAVE